MHFSTSRKSDSPKYSTMEENGWQRLPSGEDLALEARVLQEQMPSTVEKADDAEKVKQESSRKRDAVKSLFRRSSRRVIHAGSSAIDRVKGRVQSQATQSHNHSWARETDPASNTAAPLILRRSEFWLTSGTFDEALGDPPTGNLGSWEAEPRHESAAPASASPTSHETSFENPRSPHQIPGQSVAESAMTTTERAVEEDIQANERG
jgi:hypothetical protein